MTSSSPISGIYRITCIANECIYIGSAVNLQMRWNSHLYRLRRNIHHSPKMQNAFNKYGEQSFLFEVLEFILIPEMLIVREQHWFKVLNPFGKKGFNVAPIAGSRLGTKQPLEAIAKARARSLGRKFPPEFGQAISKRQMGRKPSPETCKKIGDAQRGRPGINRGRKFTSEQLERHRLARIGKKQSEEHKRKAAATRIGKKRSPETREKMRLSALGHAPTNSRTFILTSPDGIEFVVSNGLPGFCREHHLSSSTLVQVAQGRRKHHKGWTARYPEPNAE